MRHLGLNRMRTKADLIEANELPPGVAEAVFSRLHPLAHREDGEPLFLESAVDRAIEMVRGGNRPSTQINESIFESEPWSRLANRLCDFLDKMTKDQEPKRAALYLTPAEAAQILRKNVQTVMEWCRDGKVSAVKVGRKWLIPEEDIQRLFRRTRLVDGKQKGGA
jgi:excisionase family DNA binding protein